MLTTLRRRRGFTLIELLVVLVILALLAGLVLPKFLGRQKEAAVDAARAQIASFKTALDLYAVDSGGSYPTTQQGLEALVAEPSASPRPRKWTGPYVPTVPKDPWGNDYLYDSDGDTYEIISYGSDGREGGTGDAADLSSNAQQEQ